MLFIRAVLVLLAALVVGIFVVGAIQALATGDRDLLGLWYIRLIICVIFVFGGLVYYAVRSAIPKLILALLQIAGALFVDWHQLGQLAQHTEGAFERWAFIGGAFVVIADGIKKVFEATGRDASTEAEREELEDKIQTEMRNWEKRKTEGNAA